MSVKTRFAPSPTGSLHVGGARTALFSWLYARHNNGEFVLRIEDTDRERSTDASLQAILDGMSWLGLNYDGEPVYQTQRFARYTEVIEQLMSEQHAYRCYCSKERLAELRTTQQANKEKPRYDGHCRDLDLPHRDEPYVIRFRNPTEGGVTFDDQVYGSVTIQNSELDDLIIQRSDGTPTYNLTVVVDDWDMEITHVVRGDDHINNTPRQINILKALGAELPVYAHLPMILGPDGKRLSKRHGAVSVVQYRDDGYLPHAMMNYLVRLGWSHGDQELFSLNEMIDSFDLNSVSKGAASFNQEKLQWINQHYIKASEPEDIVAALKYNFKNLNVDLNNGPALTDVIKTQGERCKTLLEMAEKSRYFYEDFDVYDEKAARKNLKPTAIPYLEHVISLLDAMPAWDESNMHQVIIETAEHFEVGMGKVAQPLRVALTGDAISPSIDVTLFLVGRERANQRIKNAIDFIMGATNKT